MVGPLGPASVLDAGCSPTGTSTPVNIASAILISIIIMSRDLSLPTDRRRNGVFGPGLAG